MTWKPGYLLPAKAAGEGAGRVGGGSGGGAGAAAAAARAFLAYFHGLENPKNVCTLSEQFFLYTQRGEQYPMVLRVGLNARRFLCFFVTPTLPFSISKPPGVFFCVYLFFLSEE